MLYNIARFLLCLAVLATPLMVKAGPEEVNKVPVIIIPGIMGSELHKGDEFIWPDIVRLIAGFTDSFLSDSLKLDIYGGSVKNIEAKKVIRSMMGTDVFNGLVEELESKGYVLGEDMFFFPYDWRLNLNHTRHLLAEAVDQVMTATGSSQVDIIAHSMGGLLSKAYMNEYGPEQVRKLIFVGTPHFGAPKAYNVLLTGDIDAPFGVVNTNRIKEIAINSPAVYQLLMTHRYFPFNLKPIHKVTDGISEALGFPETYDFLKELGKNEGLISAAESFHESMPMNWMDTRYEGVEIHGIVGCKSATQFSHHVDAATGRIIYTEYGSGDGTVPNIGHLLITPHAYFIPDGPHASLPSAPAVRSLIANLLEGDTNIPSGATQSLAGCGITGKVLNWRSPVDVHAYDMSGNHIGLNSDGTLDNNIPGASFEVVDGEIYLFLPTDAGEEYEVQATGTAEGEFDLVISEITNGAYGSNTFYDDVQILSGSVIQIQVSDEGSLDLLLDMHNTGERELVTPSGEMASLAEIVSVLEIPETVEEIEPVLEEGYAEEDPPAVSSGGGGYASPVEPVASSVGAVLGGSIDLLPDGSLVLDSSDNRTIYIIGSGGKRYGFASAEDFLAHGFGFHQVGNWDLSQYEFGGIVGPGDGRHPNGSIVYDGQTIWLINYDNAYGFATMEDLNTAGFVAEDAAKMNEADKLLDKYVWF